MFGVEIGSCILPSISNSAMRTYVSAKEEATEGNLKVKVSSSLQHPTNPTKYFCRNVGAGVKFKIFMAFKNPVGQGLEILEYLCTSVHFTFTDSSFRNLALQT